MTGHVFDYSVYSFNDGAWGSTHALTYNVYFTDLARQARERYNQQTDGDKNETRYNECCPQWQKSKNIYDADGNLHRGFLN